MSKYLFTSESVTEGHPDKMCDQISDAILDAIIALDPECRVACEVTATTGVITIMGEISTVCNVDIANIARRVIYEIGYNDSRCGFDADTCAILVSLDKQSSDIAMGVNNSLEFKNDQTDGLSEIGAGDQGIMFGYACCETEELMPLPISLAHSLAKQLAKVRKEGILKYLNPDGKSQVTIEYENDQPVRIDSIIISTQHLDNIDHKQLTKDIVLSVVEPIVNFDMMDSNTKIYINPTGRFVIGGPKGDSGLTGRKIIVDTYGGSARHGGGAFSGKDPSKVDRSATYMSRYIAKNIVAANIAKKCEIQLSYGIGIAKPTSIYVNTFGTSAYSNDVIIAAINDCFDLRPLAIIEQLNLKRPIYKKLASYGHMGREDLNVKWEDTDKKDDLRSLVEKHTKS